MSAEALLSVIELARRLDGYSASQPGVTTRRGAAVDSTTDEIKVSAKKEESSRQTTVESLSRGADGENVSRPGPTLRQRATNNRKGDVIE
uniref:X protein n=1 Tax=Gaboon viper virus 1 TaxID=1889242 RepID=L0N4H8_9MONO|nr:X protein [Gaboon viper virus 1]